MSQDEPRPIRGRGASENPPNRFAERWVEPDPEAAEPEEPAPTTQFLKDSSRSILSFNDSPDVGFTVSVNPYRGCEHGCCYCYSRPTHEYLGFSSGLDFETKILVKEDAPALLRRALASPQWQAQVVAMSGVTDPYQPVERRLTLTRRCLEVFVEFRNPVVIVTKNALVTRDRDLLAELARYEAAAVYLSITTLDAGLARIMEPRTSQPARRLAAIEALAQAGVPAGVLVAPVIPGLTDHELPSIIAAATKAGARFAGYVVLRLPHGVKDLFEQWLTQHFPDRKAKVLNRIRSLRGGRLNDPRFGSRMEGEGPWATQLAGLFALACRKAGIHEGTPTLSTAAFRRPSDPQLPLFR
ncbi:MAG: PA0069 family radical SAM protein [Deltaproteobacteria bacterium]|nr:PA0069 family radical SAM protein [Deltaproteobacteria bacterium]MBI3077721.1 PA0069 family radical SAM protein [Deltaproteobacteria bacterium]